jgi:hypothetical protein
MEIACSRGQPGLQEPASDSLTPKFSSGVESGYFLKQPEGRWFESILPSQSGVAQLEERQATKNTALFLFPAN